MMQITIEETPPISDEAKKIAYAFDRADSKSKKLVRLILAEYMPTAEEKSAPGLIDFRKEARKQWR